MAVTSSPFIRWFAEIGLGDVPIVGGKNASLGEMYCGLRASGVRVPNGFATTADAYRHFMRSTGLDQRIFPQRVFQARQVIGEHVAGERRPSVDCKTPGRNHACEDSISTARDKVRNDHQQRLVDRPEQAIQRQH